MAWLLVLIASGFEIAFALSLKASVGFTKWVPGAVAVTTGLASAIVGV